MSQRRGAPAPKPQPPKTLKFIGRADYFVAGVPQTDLKVVDQPQAADEVSAGKADELIATGLYVEVKAKQQEE